MLVPRCAPFHTSKNNKVAFIVTLVLGKARDQGSTSISFTSTCHFLNKKYNRQSHRRSTFCIFAFIQYSSIHTLNLEEFAQFCTNGGQIRALSAPSGVRSPANDSSRTRPAVPSEHCLSCRWRHRPVPIPLAWPLCCPRELCEAMRASKQFELL